MLAACLPADACTAANLCLPAGPPACRPAHLPARPPAALLLPSACSQSVLQRIPCEPCLSLSSPNATPCPRSLSTTWRSQCCRLTSPQVCGATAAWSDARAPACRTRTRAAGAGTCPLRGRPLQRRPVADRRGSTAFHHGLIHSFWSSDLPPPPPPPVAPVPKLFAAADEEQKDWALYAENVRSLMGKELGVPLVEEVSLPCMRARMCVRLCLQLGALLHECCDARSRGGAVGAGCAVA